MVCWIANDTYLFRVNCFPTDWVISNWNRCSNIHLPIYLLHWNMDQKTEIRSYNKCRIRLNIDSEQLLMNCVVYMDLRPFQCTQFLGGLKLLKLGNFLLKMISILEWLKPLLQANIAAVKIVIEQDARLSVKDIACCTGISEGSVQTILKKRLDLRKVCARWVPHLLTEEQKTQRLKCAQKFWKHTKAVIVGLFLTC